MRINWRVALGVTLSIFALTIILKIKEASEMQSHSKAINFNIHSAPYTADPYEYDYFTHHAVFRSVFSTLVTEYRVGGFRGVLVSSWSTSSDYKKWSFVLKKGLKFDNGDPITGQDLIRSLKRIAYLQKKKKSHSELFTKMKGYSVFHKIDDPLDGLTLVGDSINFDFDEPMPDLLEVISFGLFSISHSKNYTSDGSWKNPKEFIGSGPYKLTKWSETEIILNLRPEFNLDGSHLKKIENIVINWSPDKKSQSDLVLSTSLEKMENFNFHGPIPAGIFYARCQSWKKEGSPCYDIKNRRALRALFYQHMSKTRIKPIRSFFPLAMSGIKEFGDVEKMDHEVKIDNLIYGYDVARPSEIESSLKHAVEEIGGTYITKNIPLNKAYDSINDFVSSEYDIYIMGSSVLSEKPNDNIRFMFLSKEGIQLPDADGRILKELEKSDFSPQVINSLIWDQAIIWPVTHFSFGLWAKPNIDFKLQNTIQPPVDFSYLGFND